MRVSVGGSNSEIEAASKKKFITEKEIKQILDSTSNLKDIRLAKTRIRDLLDFYDRIIKSIDRTITDVSSKKQLTMQMKKQLVLNKQEKELSQAKTEKNKFRKYLKLIDERLGESSNP